MPPATVPSPWLIQGFQYLEHGNASAAEQQFRQALALRPTDPHASQGLGLALIRQNRHAEARAALEQAAAALPKDGGCAANLGALLIELQDFAAAESHLRRAIRLQPKLAPAWNNLGWALMRLERLDEAESVLRRALAIAPDYPQCRQNWRDTVNIRLQRLDDAGKYREAVGDARRALAVDPDWADLRYYLACGHLLLGQLAQGWPDYAVHYDDVERFELPQWQGEPLKPGQVLMIRSEQGIGEQLMFASLLARVQANVQDIIVECDQRLVPLFTRSFPTVRCVGWTTPPDPALRDAAIAYQISLGRLPSLFLPDMESFGSGKAFLTADTEITRQRRERYGQDRPVVGISWTSGRSPAAARKNLPVAALRPLLTALHARVLILQYEPPAEDVAEIRSWGIDLIDDPELDPMVDLDGFAATIAACDHVITISNATAHFAGALGVPTSVLLSAHPLWHWFAEGNTSPWYRSVRLYRREIGQNWDTVIAAIIAAQAPK